MTLNSRHNPAGPARKWSLLSVALAGVLVSLGVPVAEGGCGGLPEEAAEERKVGVRKDEGIFVNSLATSAFVNALSANATSLQRLITQPLDSNTFWYDSHLRNALHDSNAQTFMGYFVGCALDSTQSVSWTSAYGSTTTWKGTYGLCTDWHYAAPSPECLERVSACLLARNNAHGKTVNLTMRGDDPANFKAFRLQPKVQGFTNQKDVSTPVASTVACSSTTYGPGRNCGWKTQLIGTCSPGSTVYVGGGSAPAVDCSSVLGSGSGDQMMRVCNGIRACDSGTAAVLAQNDDSCGSLLPAVSFTCPSTGTYTVMSAPYSSSGSGYVTPGVKGWTTYPAPEKNIFRIREGAFFGNIFDPGALDQSFNVEVLWFGKQFYVNGNQTVIRGSIYKNMFSCSADGWYTPEAYAYERACASPSTAENCAAAYVGACTTDSLGTGVPTKICEYEDSPAYTGDKDFFYCHAGGQQWKVGITSVLNGACDVASQNCRHTSEASKN